MQSTVSEEFLPVEGYRGAYEVSNLGRVRSTDRYRSDDDYPLTGRMMRQVNTGDGRKGVTLYLDGAGTRYLVHRLVLTAFVGPCPEGAEGCHWDGDPTNNHLDNLRWDTHLNNEADKKRHGTHHGRKKTHCPKGHVLAEPNLVPAEWARGHRKCRSCNIANASAHKRGVPFTQADADARYEHVMAGKTSAERLVCKRGHSLVAPNIFPSSLREGRKTCRACGQAKDYARTRGIPIDDAVADEKFRLIMNAA